MTDDTEIIQPPAATAPLGVTGVDYLPLGGYMDRSYLAYSLSVVLDRAIPDVRDGLKPVHRRILYAMDRLSLNPGSSHKKSARVVGDVIGKYHPHGDQSVYDAMVLMAQPFNLRHPLVDGQGNWGSIDGDSPAAMRYTEARLADASRLLLEEIDKGTVDFRPNYDGNDEEPTVLPARVPMALLNDQMGIAVGMASDIPAHNLGEVAEAAIHLYRNPDATLDELMAHVKGPDFPCGGQIVTGRDELRELYATGRGFVTVRARYEVREDADGWHMVFKELPPRVSPEQVMLEFEAISNPQPKSKDPKSRSTSATLTSDQRAAKALMLSKVSEINNGAGNDTGPVHLEVYPKSSRQKPEELALYLFSVTSLESRAKVNMNLINLAGFPAQMGLRDILSDWTKFRFITVTRRSRARLDKVEARLHLLHGLIKILLDIDEAIKIIREAENEKAAREGLIERWELSIPQADKILDLKLRQLTKLDEVELKKERKELLLEQGRLNKILGDDSAMRELIISELTADAAKFGNPRRTLIEEAAPAVFEEPVVDEPVTIILSAMGWLRSRSGHSLDLTTLSYKDGDGPHSVIETRTARPVLLFDEKGRSYTITPSQVPGGRSDGVPVSSLVDLQEKAQIVALFTAAEGDKLLLASSTGYGFITEASNLFSRNKAGKAVLNTGEGTALVPLKLAKTSENLLAASASGRVLAFGLEEIGEYPKGKGVKLLGLKPGEKLSALTVFDKTLILTHKKGKADIVLTGDALAEYVKKRGGRGKPLPKFALYPAHGVVRDPVEPPPAALPEAGEGGEGWLPGLLPN